MCALTLLHVVAAQPEELHAGECTRRLNGAASGVSTNPASMLGITGIGPGTHQTTVGLCQASRPPTQVAALGDTCRRLLLGIIPGHDITGPSTQSAHGHHTHNERRAPQICLLGWLSAWIHRPESRSWIVMLRRTATIHSTTASKDSCRCRASPAQPPRPRQRGAAVAVRSIEQRVPQEPQAS